MVPNLFGAQSTLYHFTSERQRGWELSADPIGFEALLPWDHGFVSDPGISICRGTFLRVSGNTAAFHRTYRVLEPYCNGTMPSLATQASRFAVAPSSILRVLGNTATSSLYNGSTTASKNFACTRQPEDHRVHVDRKCHGFKLG
jgi:hypothetical protein